MSNKSISSLDVSCLLGWSVVSSSLRKAGRFSSSKLGQAAHGQQTDRQMDRQADIVRVREPYLSPQPIAALDMDVGLPVAAMDMVSHAVCKAYPSISPNLGCVRPQHQSTVA